MLKKLLFAVVALVASIGMAIAAVNINTATEAELDSLPGVGPTKAKAIVDYRKANGNFKSIEDIKNVKGIGDKTFDDLKSQIAVSGATTVPAAAPAKTDVKADTKAAKSEAKSSAPKADKAEMKASSSAAKSEKKESAKATGAAASSAASAATKSEAKSSAPQSSAAKSSAAKSEKADKSKKAEDKPAK